jgi:hypothetical protein
MVIAAEGLELLSIDTLLATPRATPIGMSLASRLYNRA